MNSLVHLSSAFHRTARPEAMAAPSTHAALTHAVKRGAESEAKHQQTVVIFSAIENAEERVRFVLSASRRRAASVRHRARSPLTPLPNASGCPRGEVQELEHSRQGAEEGRLQLRLLRVGVCLGRQVLGAAGPLPLERPSARPSPHPNVLPFPHPPPIQVARCYKKPIVTKEWVDACVRTKGVATWQPYRLPALMGLVICITGKIADGTGEQNSPFSLSPFPSLLPTPRSPLSIPPCPL